MSISIARACPSPTQCVDDLWQFALYSNDGANCTEDNSKRRSREFITLQGPDVLSEHDIGGVDKVLCAARGTGGLCVNATSSGTNNL